jgi:hypothetical protein
MSSRVVQHALKHPPRCVAGLRVNSASPLLGEGPHLGDVARFALRCPCGSTAVRILGYTTPSKTSPEGPVFLAPYALGCSDCGAVTELFDPRRDGYDVEIGDCWSLVGEGDRSEFKCSKCGADQMEVVAGFEYSIDDEDLESDEEMGRHPQDFFTWFMLYGRCIACGAVQDVADYECA